MEAALWLAADLLELLADCELFAPDALIAPLAFSELPVDALFVAFELLDELLVLPLLAARLSVDPEDFTLLAEFALLEVEALVVPADLVLVFDAEPLREAAALLLALCDCAAFFEFVELFVELLLLALLLMDELLLLAE